jgi:sulfite exporter TauE/SafE
MLFLFGFLLLFAGCVLCCAGELWAVVLYLPFIAGMVWNDIEQRKKGAK